MNRLSMIALAAGLSGLATAAMAQQTREPPPPSGPYQQGQTGGQMGARWGARCRPSGPSSEAPRPTAPPESNGRQ